MKHVLSTKRAVAISIALLSLVLVVGLVLRWQNRPAEQDGRSGQVVGEVPSSEDTDGIGESAPVLDAWRRPTTTDPKAFALAYATAVWTYDTAAHDYYTWRDAVSVFADPMDSAAARIARTLLPYEEQFRQLKLHGAKASVSSPTADVTPQLKALEHDPRAPAGWHSYLVRATQSSVVDGTTSTATRQATVAVVCQPQCRFWSASSEAPQ
ncbi:hypothetical protein [Kribbella ginsengisoli]|uniref:Secreted protein n=1 Tax=Kribbella ginsengisoli TaxID=363865 RepID=A0ABP6Z512_9ACTN